MDRTARAVRKVVRIDEEKCNGCGICVPACVEGALRVVDGKARLVDDKYCDGLGACLGECPEGAITIEEREAEAFDELAAGHHMGHEGALAEEALPCGCPSSSVVRLEKQGVEEARSTLTDEPSMLAHWPVQLALIPAGAPFLRGADVMLTADCVPFSYARFHQDFLKGHAVAVACPKLDSYPAHLAKLTEILRRSDVASITVVRMEVPCCSGLTRMAEDAIGRSGRGTPLSEVVIGIRGDRKA